MTFDPNAIVTPHNLEAERAVLGAIMVDNRQFEIAAGLLTADDFLRDAHRAIWAAFDRLSRSGTALDPVTVCDALQRAGVLEDPVGGPAYVASLIQGTPYTTNVPHYAGILRDHTLRRGLVAQARRLLEEAVTSETAPAALDATMGHLMHLSTQATPGELVGGTQLAREAMAWLEDITARRSDRRTSGVPTGFFELDDMLDGFQPGDLIILAARPSQGKSAMALQLALAADGPVAFFSLEMSRGQLASRALATLARVDGWQMRRGYLGREDQARVSAALDRLADSGLSIDESSGLTVAQVRAKARRLQRASGLRMVVIDYLQLVTPDRPTGRRDQNREQEVAGMTRALKALARDLAVPVIALAQLNRATESARDKEPSLANLRESGSVEQDADVVLFIHRPDGQSVAHEGDVRLIVAKNRTGPVGSVNLRWYPPATRFEGAA